MTESTPNPNWNLESLYPTIQAWKTDYSSGEERIVAVQQFQGKLAESVETFEKALRSILESSRLLEKIYTYAHLKSDEDTSNTSNLALLDQALNLYTRFQAASSYLTPELLAIDEKRVNEFLADKRLADLKRMILDVLRYRPHTLSQKEENLLALGTEVFGAPERIYSQLHDADLQFGTVRVGDVEQPLTHSSLALFMKNPDRAVRAEAYNKYYDVFSAHRNTIAASLVGSMKGDVYLARVRNHPSALTRSTFSDNIDQSVYDNLISAVSANLTPLHRYYALRKKLLKLPELQLYDIHVPLVPDMKVRHTFEEARTLVLDSLRPLGERYCKVLGEGLTSERWIDVFEKKGKRSGAYSSGCYDSVPFILMNFKEDNFHDVFTLTHEAGHSMHSFFCREAQPYQDHSYTIFVAEVASTFNEQLLIHHLKIHYRNDKKMLAYLVNQQLDDLRSTLYRQTMFAEFEKLTHEKLERNEPITVDTYREIYRGLLVKYFGEAMTFHPLSDLECLRIPHFYSAFYVYKYSTGISAAVSLARQVLEGGNAERERYLKMLSSGCTKYSLELLKDGGVDLTKPEPVTTALKLFDSLVHELEVLLGT